MKISKIKVHPVKINVVNCLCFIHCVKSVQIRTRKNSVFGQFSHSDSHVSYCFVLKSFPFEFVFNSSATAEISNVIIFLMTSII